MINIWFEGKPVPASRPRVTRKGTYNEPKYTAYKKALGLVAKSKIKKPLENEVSIKIDFFYEIPKSWTKKKKTEAKWHKSKPDIDNLIKSVLDGLNGIAYKDDGQVVQIMAKKQYTNGMAGVKILIEKI